MRNHDGQNFVDFIRTFRRGDLSEALDADMQELLEAIKATNSGGTFALTLKIKPNKKTGALEIDAGIKITKPKMPIPTGIYFVGDDFRPSRRNPDQSDIEDLPGVAPQTRN